jgi:hypothetical protein
MKPSFESYFDRTDHHNPDGSIWRFQDILDKAPVEMINVSSQILSHPSTPGYLITHEHGGPIYACIRVHMQDAKVPEMDWPKIYIVENLGLQTGETMKGCYNGLGRNYILLDSLLFEQPEDPAQGFKVLDHELRHAVQQMKGVNLEVIPSLEGGGYDYRGEERLKWYRHADSNPSSTRHKPELRRIQEIDAEMEKGRKHGLQEFEKGYYQTAQNYKAEREEYVRYHMRRKRPEKEFFGNPVANLLNKYKAWRQLREEYGQEFDRTHPTRSQMEEARTELEQELKPIRLVSKPSAEGYRDVYILDKRSTKPEWIERIKAEEKFIGSPGTDGRGGK